MAVLEIKVTFVGDGDGTLVDNAVNRATIFQFAPAVGGNTPRGRYPSNYGPLSAYDLNNVATPGCISVTSYSPIRFDSSNFFENPALVNDVATRIERGVVRVVDVAAPGVELTREDLTEFQKTA